MKNTIKANEDIDFLFKNGKRINTPLVTALYSKETVKRGHEGRVAYIAGKKLGNAVFRNRCKRVMRENARNFQAIWDCYDVVFIARNKRVAKADPDQLQESFSMIMQKGPWKQS